MENQTQATININGKEYEIAALSDTVKSLLVVYNTWQADREKSVKALADAKIEVAKNEAALRDLSKEIVDAVEAQSEAQSAADPAVTPAP